MNNDEIEEFLYKLRDLAEFSYITDEVNTAIDIIERLQAELAKYAWKPVSEPPKHTGVIEASTVWSDLPILTLRYVDGYWRDSEWNIVNPEHLTGWREIIGPSREGE